GDDAAGFRSSFKSEIGPLPPDEGESDSGPEEKAAAKEEAKPESAPATAPSAKAPEGNVHPKDRTAAAAELQAALVELKYLSGDDRSAEAGQHGNHTQAALKD